MTSHAIGKAQNGLDYIYQKTDRGYWIRMHRAKVGDEKVYRRLTFRR